MVTEDIEKQIAKLLASLPDDTRVRVANAEYDERRKARIDAWAGNAVEAARRLVAASDAGDDATIHDAIRGVQAAVRDPDAAAA